MKHANDPRPALQPPCGTPRPLHLQDFSYELPAELIAQTPCHPRDQARLLCVQPRGAFSHHYVTDLVTLLPANCLVVCNDTRVFASRLLGQLPSGGKCELFLLESPQGSPQAQARAMGKPLPKLLAGCQLQFAGGLQAEVGANAAEEEGGPLRVSFDCDEHAFLAWAQQHGHVPLPPYIKREKPLPAALSADGQTYQTVYARHLGSVAAPTAGLHFSHDLLARLQARGVEFTAITLHVGAGTFLPVKHEDVSQHPMHKEKFRVDRSSLEALLAAKAQGRKVVAIGTTSLRCVESLYQQAAQAHCKLQDLSDRWLSTQLFIRPRHSAERYRSAVFDGLFTNFHQPCSTLFMLVCALLGFAKAHELYQQAVAERYRFLSYGDSSLLWFPKP